MIVFKTSGWGAVNHTSQFTACYHHVWRPHHTSRSSEGTAALCSVLYPRLGIPGDSLRVCPGGMQRVPFLPPSSLQQCCPRHCTGPRWSPGRMSLKYAQEQDCGQGHMSTRQPKHSQQLSCLLLPPPPSCLPLSWLSLSCVITSRGCSHSTVHSDASQPLVPAHTFSVPLH